VKNEVRHQRVFKFAEGDAVTLIGDYPNLGLSTGAVGVVWAFYATRPPCYEVTWRDKNGLDFDMTMDEEELTHANRTAL
jgi:hypothetical protein